MRNGSALHSPMKELRKDLHAVARDTEALLKATADVAGERVQEARARTQQSLSNTIDHLYDRQMRRRVKRLARNTDTYVRDHSWTVLGAVAGVALLLGVLTRRD
jgi:ElaB/YqjD/DUF883 family membrane-anchored ribosome-binding protein